MSAKPEQLVIKAGVAIRQLRAELTDSAREYRDRIRRLEKIRESIENASTQPEGELVDVSTTLSPDDLSLLSDPTRGL